MDFLECLTHSWGTKPEQKKREKEYNAKYYKDHKEKWGIKVPTVNDYQPYDTNEEAGYKEKSGIKVPMVDNYDTYKYVPSKRKDLPEGVYPRTREEKEQWALRGIHYDPTIGRYYKVDPALTVDMAYSRQQEASRNNIARSSQAKAKNEAEKLIKAKQNVYQDQKRRAIEKNNIARSSQANAKNEAEKLIKAKTNSYLNEKRREINEKTIKDAQKTNAKKAREFIDGCVEYTIDNAKKFVKDFFGW